MQGSNPLVPSVVWGETSPSPWTPDDDDTQKLLCWVCVSQGVTEPPKQIVIAGGNSYCLPHAIPQQ